ncbi:MAG TPA: hypothetical protein VFM09_12635 [Marmoricola sp.]|nr:hypothetical protein [Marmoricola sp.]
MVLRVLDRSVGLGVDRHGGWHCEAWHHEAPWHPFAAEAGVSS